MKRSYSVEEVAAAHLPAEWTDSARWLRRRLNWGELTGFRVGKVWRMTDEDVEFLIAKHRNITRPAIAVAPAADDPPDEPTSFAAGLSQRSRKRLKSA